MYHSELDEKIHLLMKHGFNYIAGRDIYCNLQQNKCFSLEYIEDNPIKRIRRNLSEHPKLKMVFYFIKKPSPELRHKLEYELKPRTQKPRVVQNVRIKKR
jgi:hypothetical protein